MNRRGFMKVLLGCSAAMGIPVVGKAVSNKPVIVVGPDKPGADETVSRWGEDSWDAWDYGKNGGYIMTEDMSESLRKAMAEHNAMNDLNAAKT